MDSKLPKNFCILPFIHLYAKPDGACRLCCMANDSIGNYNVKFNSIEEVWNSPEYNEKRRHFLNGERLSECNECWENEDAGKVSKRQREMQQWEHVFEQKDIDNFAHDTHPRYLDLRFGNLCNLKCRMCGVWASSQWEKDIRNLSTTENDPTVIDAFAQHGDIDKTSTMDWFTNNSLWEELDNIAKGIEEVYFTGGEPTLIEEHKFLLNKLRDINPKALIRYNTNLTNVTEDWLKTLQGFDRVRVTASLDGVGPVNELIRYPSKWHKLEENFDKLMSIGDNIEPSISCAVQVLNAPKLSELYNWKLQKEKQFGKHIWLSMNAVFAPTFLDPRLLDYGTRCDIFDEMIAWVAHDRQKEEIVGMANFILSSYTGDRNEELHKLANHVTVLDKMRGQDTLATAPWLKRLQYEK